MGITYLFRRGTEISPCTHVSKYTRVRVMTLQHVDTEYVAEASRREGEGAFYYRKPGEPQLFRTRESAILGIRQFIVAFGPDDVVSEGYDIEAIFNERVHPVSKPPFFMKDTRDGFTLSSLTSRPSRQLSSSMNSLANSSSTRAVRALGM